MDNIEKPVKKTNNSKLARNLTIANARLKGASFKKLAEDFGLTTAGIAYILKDDQIADVINTGLKYMVACVPKAVDNYLNKEDGFLFSKNDKVRQVSSDNVLKMVGILPSHTQNTYINNLTQVNNTVLSPNVNALLNGIIPNVLGDDNAIEGEIIDAEATESVVDSGMDIHQEP